MHRIDFRTCLKTAEHTRCVFPEADSPYFITYPSLSGCHSPVNNSESLQSINHYQERWKTLRTHAPMWHVTRLVFQVVPTRSSSVVVRPRPSLSEGGPHEARGFGLPPTSEGLMKSSSPSALCGYQEAWDIHEKKSLQQLQVQTSFNYVI